MADIDFDALESLASAATPGPWHVFPLGSEGIAVVAEPGSAPGGHPKRVPRVAFCGHEQWEVDKANAAFVAALDPSTVRALISLARQTGGSA